MVYHYIELAYVQILKTHGFLGFSIFGATEEQSSWCLMDTSVEVILTVQKGYLVRCLEN